ncbi:hypothetical protein EW145_g5987 [Phellinidium pouzarii]|uniref:Uncharacterized protein n=1 Tax=Phellinidium pouzarii TaxID=167371 RepID=A0A4S4KYN6_9AGAM|nr:hypothetical protein EW145_g5987 [Phellinidium pouzarii]
MFTYNGRDAHRNNTTSRVGVNCLYKPAIVDILPEHLKTDDDEVDTALQRLPAPGLKTCSMVYNMEEEYRMQKAL